jgi:hypothetical protein
MAQHICTELEKRKIPAAMFLTIFIGLPGAIVLVAAFR